MKKIFNSFFNQVTLTLSVMLMVGTVAFGQCPSGQLEVTVTYTGGSFNGENSWLLWDATAGAAVLCDDAAAVPGTYTACTTNGNTLELYAYETFGDNWNGATLSFAATDDGTGGSCVSNEVFVDADDDPGGADGNGSLSTGVCANLTSPETGALVIGGVVLGCSECEIVCPDNIVVGNTAGICAAIVECPPPTFDPAGCNLVTPVAPVTLAAELEHSTIPGFPNGTFANNVGTYTIDWDISAICDTPMPVACVDEICFDLVIQGDYDFITEQIILTSTDLGISWDSDATNYGQCSVVTLTSCFDAAQWDALRADCSVDMTLQATGTGISSTLCAFNGLKLNATMATACDIFEACVDLPDGSTVDGKVNEFPVGVSCVTYKALGGTIIPAMGGTGSGTGASTPNDPSDDFDFGAPGIPIECKFTITVEDTEAPVFVCPEDRTFNLQSGECCELVDYTVFATDNCGLAVSGTVPSPAQFEGCDQGLAAGSTFDNLYFDIENNSTCNAIFLETINIPVWAGLGSGTFAWEVYTTPGTSVGNELNAAAWTLAGSLAEATYSGGDIATVPLNGTEMIGCEGGFILAPGESIGVAVGFPVQYTGSFGIEYTFGACTPPVNADGLNLVSNGATTTQFAGTLLTPRGFVGDFDYSVLDLCASGGIISEVIQTSGLPTGSTYSVGVYPHVFTAEDCSGNVANCEFEIVVNDIANVTSNLTCDDQVNVSVDANCQVLITADMFLEGGPYSCIYDCYEVYIEDEHGNIMEDLGCTDQIKPELDASDVSSADVNGCTVSLECGTYTYIVYDACRDNRCWGTFVVEDKTAPEIVPPADVSITCMQDAAPSEDCLGSTSVLLTNDLLVANTAGVNVSATTSVSGLPAAAAVTSISVDFEMSHTWLGDIDVTLTGPDGTVVTLLDGQCGANNNISVTFDDTNGTAQLCGTSTEVIADCSAPTQVAMSGIVVTDSGNLSSFVGGGVNGDWTLTVNDPFNGDGGCVSNAAINVEYIIVGVEAATLLNAGCGDELTFVDDPSTSDCDGGFITRTWVATDSKGNQSTYDQRIDIIQVGAAGLGADWFWPNSVVDLNCGVDSSPEGIYAYYTGLFEELTPCPEPLSCDDDTDPWVKARNTAGVVQAFPNFLCDKIGNLGNFQENNCNMIFDYSDTVLNACGADCPGNAKIIRTWTALDWCTADVVDFVQIIHAKDTEAPVIDLRVASVVAGYNPWGCLADVRLPEPEHLTDNCSPTVDYTVSGNAGVTTFVPVEGGVGYWVVSGVGKDDHSVDTNADGILDAIPYTYTATDCCGNESTATIFVTVVDNSPPVPVAIENIVVGLTFSPTNPEAGSAKVYVDMIDNGSHDGTCGIVRKAIRRVDDESCGNIGVNGHDNNSTFFNFNDLNPQPEDHDIDDTDGGQFIKLCCNDLINGDGEDLDGDGVNDYVNIIVELGVWDDADCDGWPGSTAGDRFSKTWANVRLEAKVSPVLSCPPNAMITCDVDETSESVINTILGSATASTACGALDAKYTDVCDWDQNGDGDFSDDFTMMGETGSETFNKACHHGPIVRTWSIPGTSKSCEQIIIIKAPTTLFNGSYYLTDVNGDYLLNGTRPVENDNIDWPYESDAVDIEDDNFDDYSEVLLECVDDLGDEEPTWVTTHCSLIGWSLDSDTLDFEGDACRKIINRYCVIDWCQYDPNGLPLVASNGDMKQTAEAPGKWCWTVIGKLVDTTAPIVTAGNDMFEAIPGGGGSGGFATTSACVTTSAEMTAIGTDGDMSVDGTASCPSSWLKWVVLVDAYDDWSYDFEWSSFIAEDNPSSIPCGTDTNGNGIPDVRVGSGACAFDSADDFATSPGEAYTVYISQALASVGIQLEADCGETQHRVEWTVYDGCGNLSSTTSYFTVQDKKAPTPYCVNLSTALMDVPVGGGDATVELWAIDFDAGSFDNCTSDEELLFTFSDDASTVIPEFRSAAMTFTCDDLAGGNPALLTIPVYVWDGCGNRDFCLVNLRLVDNNGACNTGDPTGSDIAGVVMTEAGQTVENVDVMNEQVTDALEMHEMTDNAGNYMFTANSEGMDYQLSGTKNDDYLNGISTIDLVMIQRHILGIQTLDSAYKMIAADINNDNVIDGRDLVELRKLILGIYTELPQNDSWRFGDANQTLDINSPWNFDESIEVTNLSAPMMTEDFVGVKIGDVSGDVIANLTTPTVGASSNGAINIDFQDVQVEVGQTVEIEVSANLSDVYGYQFTLATPGLQLVGINAGSLNVTEANFGVFGDVVTTSYNNSKAISTSDNLFTMTFKSAVAGQLSEILDLNSDITRAEAYVGSNFDVVEVNLNNTAATSEFALEQNEPNPFSANTVIGFQMAETADATMTVYDVTGKVVSVINGNYTKGYNEIELSKSDLGVSGVLYYQFDSGDFTATKKMIIIE